MLLIILFLLLFYFFAVSEYGWKGGLVFTIIVGFLQDPIRKATGINSSYFGALSLAFFLLTFLALRNQHRLWYLRYICWNNPRLISLIPLFFYIIGFQALNSYARFGDIKLPIIGAIFYLLPLIGLWVGFHIGSDRLLLRRFMLVYLVACSICAVSVFLSVQGVENSLFKEVGEGLVITGFGSGHSGFWRTSEIAGWHLAAGSCIAFILGVTETKTTQQILYFSLSLGLAFLGSTTGRRKALGIVIIFISLYLLFFTLSSTGNKVTRVLTSLILISALAVSSSTLLFSSNAQSELERSAERASTLTIESSQGRFTSQGIGAFVRGLEIAGPIGLGVGAGSNSGTTGLDRARAGVRSLSYVSEGGGGRIVAELGIFGTIIFLYILLNLMQLYYRNFILAKSWLVEQDYHTVVGLLIFTIVNGLTFFTAGQLYSDPFVLIILGLALGSFLGVPILAARQKQFQTPIQIQ